MTPHSLAGLRQLSMAAALLPILGGAMGAQATDAPVEPLQKAEISGGHFNGAIKKKIQLVSTDLSGIACQDEGPVRHCVVIDDQLTSAQAMTLDVAARKIVPGEAIPLIGKVPKPSDIGKPPKKLCSGDPEFKDLDGEAVAFADGHYYVVGSHGCGRKKDNLNQAAFQLVRFKADAPDSVQRSYRLVEVLAEKAPQLKPFFGKKLLDPDNHQAVGEDGLNIEGLAVLGQNLYLGLRAPATKQPASLVKVPLEALFDASVALPEAVVTDLDLGPSYGIRDIAPLGPKDSRVLLLAGPAQERNDPYRIFLHDTKTGATTPLATLADVQEPVTDKGETKDVTGKAEGLLVVEQDQGQLLVLILFDGLPDGGARFYRIKLPS